MWRIPIQVCLRVRCRRTSKPMREDRIQYRSVYGLRAIASWLSHPTIVLTKPALKPKARLLKTFTTLLLTSRELVVIKSFLASSILSSPTLALLVGVSRRPIAKMMAMSTPKTAKFLTQKRGQKKERAVIIGFQVARLSMRLAGPRLELWHIGLCLRTLHCSLSTTSTTLWIMTRGLISMSTWWTTLEWRRMWSWRQLRDRIDLLAWGVKLLWSGYALFIWSSILCECCAFCSIYFRSNLPRALRVLCGQIAGIVSRLRPKP